MKIKTNEIYHALKVEIIVRENNLVISTSYYFNSNELDAIEQNLDSDLYFIKVTAIEIR